VKMPDHQKVVETFNLCRRSKGCNAVEDLSLNIDQGDIFGIIGLNGSGKTTVIKVLATVIKPSSGSATILGYDLAKNPDKIKSLIGYVPQSLSLNTSLKVHEYLDFFASAYKIPKKDRKQVVSDIIELFLSAEKDHYIQNLSHGMMQRLSLARAIIHDPALLILDEPAYGLDPKARAEFWEILKELHNMGKTIIIASNILSDIANICNKIGIIKDGKLIFNEDRGNLSQDDMFLKLME